MFLPNAQSASTSPQPRRYEPKARQGRAAGRRAARQERAGLPGRERGCGSDAARGAQQHREPRAGRCSGAQGAVPQPRSLFLPPGARSAQGSATSPAPRCPQRRGPKRPRGAPLSRTAVQPYPEGAAPLPAPPGGSSGSGCAGGSFAPSSGQGWARRAPTAPHDAAKTKSRSIPARPMGTRRQRGSGRPCRPGAWPKPVSRSRHEGTRRAAPTPSGAPFCGAKSLRRGTAMAAAPGDGGAADASLPSRTAPLGKLSPRGPRPRRGPGRSLQSPALGDPAAPRARRPPRVRPPLPASPSRTGCSRLPPPPPTSRCPPTCPRSAGIIPGAGGAGRGRLLARRARLRAAGKSGERAEPRPCSAAADGFIPRAEPCPRCGEPPLPSPRRAGAPARRRVPGLWRRLAAARSNATREGAAPERGLRSAATAGGSPGGCFRCALYGRAGRDLVCLERHLESWEICYRQELHLARALGDRTTPRLSKSCSCCAGGEQAGGRRLQPCSEAASALLLFSYKKAMRWC